MNSDLNLLKNAAVNVLVNPRANRTAARLAKAFLELLVENERLRMARGLPPRATAEAWRVGDRFRLTMPCVIDALDLPVGATGRISMVSAHQAYAVFDEHRWHYPVPVSFRWLGRVA